MKAAKHTENCKTMRFYKTYTHVALAYVKTKIWKLPLRMTSSNCNNDFSSIKAAKHLEIDTNMGYYKKYTNVTHTSIRQNRSFRNSAAYDVIHMK